MHFVFPALLGTLAQIVRVRPADKPEHKAAAGFLRWLDTEKALQAALLADAGEEHKRLMRLLDYEGFPPESLSHQLGAFVSRIMALFGVGGGPAEAFNFGYTAHMVHILKHPILLPGAEVHVVGSEDGLPEGARDRCLKRMSNWVAAVAQTLRAEFPSFEVLQAWGVFNVVRKDPTENSDQWCHKRLEQLRCLVECFWGTSLTSGACWPNRLGVPCRDTICVGGQFVVS